MKQPGLKGSVTLIVAIPLIVVTACAIVYNYNLDVGTEQENTAYAEPVFEQELKDISMVAEAPQEVVEPVVEEESVVAEEPVYEGSEYQEYISYVENTYGTASGDAASFQQMGVISCRRQT